MTDSASQASALASLQDWYRSPLGADVAALESVRIERQLNDTFGYYLVQVGVTETFREALAASRIRHRILMSCQPEDRVAGRQIVGLPNRLPFAADSIDAMFLPHTLDFWPEPRAAMREVERVLIPEGRVIIMGFNMFSAWGLWSLLRRRNHAPWNGRFRAAYQIEGWLSELGFDIEMREHILFRLPIRGALGPSHTVLDRMGERLWPILGGVYLIRAVKRVATLTPLRPSWRRRRVLLPSRAVEPTARGTGRV